MVTTTDIVDQPDPVISEAHQLKRSLGPLSLVMIGIGGIIGSGIFVYTGTAAAEHAGPAVMLSFVVAGFGCLFAGFCYAEFASMIPESGSSYTYAYATMGRFMAWFIGWNMVLEYLVSAAGVSAGWSGYLVSLLNDFGIHLPAALTMAPFAGKGFNDIHLTGALINVPAVGLIAILSTFLVIGVKESARFNGLMVLIKVAIVLAVIVFGISYVQQSNLTPFIPPNPAAAGKTGLDAFRAEFSNFGQFGITGILAASGIAFFAYIGFEAVSVAAQECRNPSRDMPIGILGSLGICTALYMLMSLVLTGITDWRTLDVPSPVSFAVSKIAGLNWLVIPIDVGAVVGLASVVFVSLYGQSRVFFSMARDGFLPPGFSAVHPRFKTPHRGTIIVGAFAALLAALFPFDVLADLVSIGTLAAFITVCIGIMVLRVQAPKARRHFRTPYVWLTAPAGVLICGLMMVSLGGATWIRLVIWTVIGLVIYAAYGVRHAAPSKWKVKNES
ncbi:MAG TPA: amino acid permease [Rhizomicrobium sp.]|jgi:APA family basic amino acid/polyamine antiporter|nr:amino acid permease [Rhizomicrobium sp.]